MVKLFIDPGHGGSDSGATGNGLKEKDLTLKIALKMRDKLKDQYKGVSIKLSRTKDTTVSLSNRTTTANQWGADYLISVHINAGGGVGFESYIYNGSYNGKNKTNQLRNKVHQSIIKEVDFKDRGRKEANFHMLRESNMSAVLTENGFIDSKTDANKLKKDSFLDRIAQGHVSGLANAFQLKKKQSKQTTYTIKKGDTLWSISQKYGTTVKQLQQWNPGVVSERLKIGKKLVVNSKGATTYTIKKGDTLWSIAQSYGTTVKELERLNPNVKAKKLQIGSKIKVR